LLKLPQAREICSIPNSQAGHRLGAPGTLYVHGDARDVNVLVKLVEGSLPIVQFCDFDWAGLEGGNEVYPLLMSPSVGWAASARPGQPLKQEHDVHLLQRGGALFM